MVSIILLVFSLNAHADLIVDEAAKRDSVKVADKINLEKPVKVADEIRADRPAEPALPSDETSTEPVLPPPSDSEDLAIPAPAEPSPYAVPGSIAIALIGAGLLVMALRKKRG